MDGSAQPAASAGYRLILSPGATMRRDEDGLTIGGFRGALKLTGPMLALTPAVEALAREIHETDLLTAVDDPALAPMLLYLLAQMDAKGLVHRTVLAGDTPLATLVPMVGKRAAPRGGLDPDQRWRLSRFAYLRREDEAMVLESPLSSARLIVRSARGAAALHRLSAAAGPDDLAASAGLDRQAARDLLGLLVAGGFVEAEGAVESDATRLWEFHDLLFHGRSRLGRHDQPYGGVYAFPDLAPLPALKPGGEGPRVALASAPSEADEAHDSLRAIMARRRSIRAHGVAPIDLAQLGAFLHRSARHLATLPTDHGELAARPYPAGGALHELELYLVVDRCAGLERGLYHYRTGDHALERLTMPGLVTEALLDQASATLGGAGRPQVLFVITARFQRLSWKYRSMVYALVLKHVGVLYQTLYLIATDMGLAPCAMGGGDSDLFAEASGLDPLVEASVGEFALGSREVAPDAG
ncbi:SagB family peptide dehydrogenase [soil metagenome]